MLYSFRKSKELPYPDLKSPEAANALKMLKKIYNEISSSMIIIIIIIIIIILLLLLLLLLLLILILILIIYILTQK